jgi:hypothetical protein
MRGQEVRHCCDRETATKVHARENGERAISLDRGSGDRVDASQPNVVPALKLPSLVPARSSTGRTHSIEKELKNLLDVLMLAIGPKLDVPAIGTVLFDEGR